MKYNYHFVIIKCATVGDTDFELGQDLIVAALRFTVLVYLWHFFIKFRSLMNNVNLYRKYRPNTLAEVVGQTNIVQTLENEISMNKLTHAYLFSGPRGCGKTSIAKIFSKLVNDVTIDNSYVDIWEMDAASNNGVEEIRKVIESVNYLPVELKYKVYIIDEVHMLSKAAFNALLKTLEEPPAYAIFILATTEIQKIPPTIISRCQRFDFNRISIDDMVKRMSEILSIENITYEEDALIKVASLADGAMRDALSILESVISNSGSVTVDNINKVLNIVDKLSIDKILNYIDNKDVVSVINLYEELKIKGIDDIRFLNDIITVIKDKIINDGIYYYSKFLPLLTEASVNIEYSKAKSLVLEILFIELCDLDPNTTGQARSNIKPTTQEVRQVPHIVELKTTTPVEAPVSNIVELNTNSVEEVATSNIKLEIKQPATEKVIEIKKPTKELKPEEIDLIDDLFASSSNSDDFEEVKTQVVEETNVIEPKMPVVEDKQVVETNTPVETKEPVIVNYEENDESFKLDKVVEKVVTEQIGFIDVLKAATAIDKERYINNKVSFITEANNQNLRSIGIFFEECNIVAASTNSVIISTNDTFITDFNKKIKEISDIITSVDNTCKYVFLIGEYEWSQKRSRYIQELKKEQTIYDVAVNNFGQNIVRKV